MATLDYSRVVEAGKGWTKVQLNDGTIVTVKGDRATRNNNPGNIEYGGFTRSQGAIGSDGRFAVFPTREAGIAAQAALIFSNPNYQDLTLAEAIAKYAPPNENDTTAYANKVSEQSGVSLDTVMRDMPASQRKAVVVAMQGVEGNHPVKAYHEDGSLAYSIKPNESGKLQSRGDMYGQAAESMGEAGVRSVAGLGAQPGGGPIVADTAGGLGALFSGDWVEPMLNAYREQAGNRPPVDGLATRSVQPSPERFGPVPFGGSAFAGRDTPGLAAPNFARDIRGQRQTAPTQATVLQAAGNLPGHNIAGANNFGLAHGPAGLMRTGLPDTVVRSTTVPETAQRYGVPNPNTGFLMMNSPGVKGDRQTAPATMPTAAIDPMMDPRAAAYATGIQPGQKQVVTPQSMLNAAKTLDSALGPLGQNIMRVVDAVRTPGNRMSESYPAGTEEMAGRVRRVESKGQPGGNYAGSGLSATMSVRSGTTPVGTIAHSRSDPSVSLVSLPGGRVAHVNDKHGFISTWSPADDDELGTTYGKTLAIDPAGSKYGYFSPGKVPTGWATYSPGKGFSKGIAAVSNARSYGPGIFGGFGKGKLGGVLGGIFGRAPAANVAPAQAPGLAGFLSGLFGGPAGGLGAGPSGGPSTGGLGGYGNPGFGGGISSNSNYGGR